MSKHNTRKNKKHIKRKLNRRKKTNNRKTNYRKKTNNRKNTNYRKKTKRTKKTYKMKGGNGKNTLTPSPIMNGWYDIMNAPTNYFLTYRGIEVPNNMNSDPTQGHNI